MPSLRVLSGDEKARGRSRARKIHSFEFVNLGYKIICVNVYRYLG